MQRRRLQGGKGGMFVWQSWKRPLRESQGAPKYSPHALILEPQLYILHHPSEAGRLQSTAAGHGLQSNLVRKKSYEE